MYRLLIWRSALRPSLNLSLTDEGSLASLVNFSRASAGWRFNAQGVLEQVAADQPRHDTDPISLTPRGLLVEEQRTNSVRSSNANGALTGVIGSGGALPTNWSYGALAGITVTVLGTGSEDGIPYVDLGISGSATGSVVIGYEGGNIIAAASGETWSSSAYYRLTSGSLANIALIHQLVERNSGGSLLVTSDAALAPGNGPLRTQRSGVTRLFNQASTAYSNSRLWVSCSGAVSLSLRIGCPQQEKGSHVSSPIITVSSIVTRAADSMSVSSLAGWFQSAHGTLRVEAERPAEATSSGVLAEFNDGTAQNRLSLLTGNSYQVGVVTGGTSQALMGTYSPVASGVFGLVGAWKSNDFAAACSTNASTDTDSSGTMPTVTQLYLGARGTNDTVLNGWLRKVQYWPRRLGNTILQKWAAQ
ncbi:MAG: hypothetical protein IPI58_06680 [Alphaproteobacteria bacterium]|nr:MAG: hypothetical protein IPI58_06680 [Alphaproteobacteria bacterium]